MKNYDELTRRLKNEIIDRIDLTRDVSDDEIKEMIHLMLLQESKREYIPAKTKEVIATDIFFAIRKLDVLQNLIDNPAITEIMINGYDSIFIEENGHLSKWNRQFESREKLSDVVQQIVAGCNRTVNEVSPVVDARLADGARVNVVLQPVALNGPIVTIRRFPKQAMTMQNLIGLGAISTEAAEFLRVAVVSGYNIFISGGTGSGKTTFLNALSQYIPCDERIITIEDSAELQIQGIENLVRLETRNGNREGCKDITIRDLIRSSLRMRPDRIIVGEVRGAEAIDMIQCLNTGHDGSLSTGHANSAADMLARLETMTLMGIELPLPAIRRQIAGGLDLIVHLGRMRDKSRKVLQIVEVTGYEDGEIKLSTLFEFEESKKGGSIVTGALQKKEELQCRRKWENAGFA